MIYKNRFVFLNDRIADMKNFATLKNEISGTLCSFIGSVNVSLYDDKFYIVEGREWYDFIKCGKLLESDKSLKSIGDGMFNCYYVGYK